MWLDIITLSLAYLFIEYKVLFLVRELSLKLNLILIWLQKHGNKESLRAHNGVQISSHNFAHQWLHCRKPHLNLVHLQRLPHHPGKSDPFHKQSFQDRTENNNPFIPNPWKARIFCRFSSGDDPPSEDGPSVTSSSGSLFWDMIRLARRLLTGLGSQATNKRTGKGIDPQWRSQKKKIGSRLSRIARAEEEEENWNYRTRRTPALPEQLRSASPRVIFTLFVSSRILCTFMWKKEREGARSNTE